MSVGRRLAMFGIGAAVPIGLAVRRFMEFDDQMRIVRAVTVGTEREFQQLTETAKRLGATTSFTAVEVAQLMAELGRAGFARSEIEATTTAVLNLARASSTDAAISAKILGETLRQFGIAARDSARVADALTVTANRSVTTVESLGESLQYVGPVAAQFNVSLEDTLAIIGALGNIGIQGSNAGTALRRLLILTGTQSAEIRRMFGVNAQDAAGNARPLVDVLVEINDALAGLGTGQRQARLFELFGFLGITGASGIAQNATNVRDLADALSNAQGAAAAAAEEMDRGIGGTWRRLRGAVEGVAIAIGESLAPVLRLIGNWLRDVLNAARDWIKNSRDTIVQIGFVVAAVIGLGAALIGLGVAFKLLGFAIGALGVVLAVAGGGLKILLGLMLGILSPTAIVVATLAAGVLAWANFSEAGQAATISIRSNFGTILRVVNTAMGGIMDAIANADIQGAWDIALLGMQASWASATAAMRSTWREFRDWIVDTFWSAVYAIGRAMAHVADQMVGAVLGLANALHSATRKLGLSPFTDEQIVAMNAAAGNQGAGILGQLNQMQEEERRLRAAERAAAASGDQTEADRIRRILEQRREKQAEERRRRAIRDEFKGLTGGELGRLIKDSIGIPSAVRLAAAGADVVGTFAGSTAGLLGVGPSVTRVQDEGVRNEVRGLRRDVQENGGVAVT